MRYSQEWLEFVQAWATKGETHPQEAWWKWVSVISGEPIEYLRTGSSETFRVSSPINRERTELDDAPSWTWRGDEGSAVSRNGTPCDVCFDVKFADGTVQTYRTREPL